MEECCQKQKQFEERIFRFVNRERKKLGLLPLTLDQGLTKAARIKARDMAENHYFDHISPTLKSPLNMIRSFGLDFGRVGENIACGFTDPHRVFREWMKSRGHRLNILSPEYSHIGVGYHFSEKDEFKHYWVQEFGRK